MLDFIEWILRWVQVIPWIVMVASAIAMATDTPKDDKLIGKIYKYIDIIALNFNKAKMK